MRSLREYENSRNVQTFLDRLFLFTHKHTKSPWNFSGVHQPRSEVVIYVTYFRFPDLTQANADFKYGTHSHSLEHFQILIKRSRQRPHRSSHFPVSPLHIYWQFSQSVFYIELTWGSASTISTIMPHKIERIIIGDFTSSPNQGQHMFPDIKLNPLTLYSNI